MTSNTIIQLQNVCGQIETSPCIHMFKTIINESLTHINENLYILGK
jgi:hypothetical protein